MLVPETVLQNRYTIVRRLGQGGMGAVYEALDNRFNNTVAIKQTFYETGDLSKAFEREARLLRSLKHRALPGVIDYFVENEGAYLVMDFVPGQDLGALIEMRVSNGSGAFALEDVLEWTDELLDVLEYLHSHEPPIIHRDIKPQNLKLTPKGELRVLDFGLAKGSADGKGQTADGKSILGYTPHYASLEQVHGIGTTERSDLYSAAATIYHLLTGVKPPDALQRTVAQVAQEPDPLRPAWEANLEVPVAVSDLLAKVLSQNPKERPASAREMREALRVAVGAPPPVELPSPRPVPMAETAPDGPDSPTLKTLATHHYVPPPPPSPSEAPPAPARSVPVKAIVAGVALLSVLVLLVSVGWFWVRYYSARQTTAIHQTADPAGWWNQGTITIGGRPQPARIFLQIQGSSVKGEMQWGGRSVPVTGGSWSNGQLVLVVVDGGSRMTFTGSMSGSRLSGTWSSPQQSGAWSAGR